MAVRGDPTEGALLVMAKKAGFDDPDGTYTRVDELPFDSDRKLMSVLVKRGEDVYLLTKGAPDVLLDRCTKILSGEREEQMSSDFANRRSQPTNRWRETPCVT